MPTKHQHDRLYRKVVDHLMSEIRQGLYKAGDRLPAERDLAETFGVSRPSVREAMIALEILGLIRIRGRSGAYVTEAAIPQDGDEADLSQSRVDLNVGAFELIEARILIEGETAGLAAITVSQDDVDHLMELIGQMRAANDYPDFESADRAFHAYIASITENGALVDAIDHLWELRTRSPLASQIMNRAMGGGFDARIAEHEAIVRALAAHNPIAARGAMRTHLEKVREYLLDATETLELDALREKLRTQRQAVVRRTKATAAVK